MSRPRTRVREAARHLGHQEMLERHFALSAAQGSSISEIPEIKEDLVQADEEKLETRFDIMAHVSLLLANAATPDYIREFWVHLTRAPSSAALNWNPENPWRPWKSEFELMWWLVYIRRDWTVAEFDDMRTMVVWMIQSHMIPSVTDPMCRTYRALRKICQCLPGPPPPKSMNTHYLRGPTVSSQTPLEWSTMRDSVDASPEQVAAMSQHAPSNISAEESCVRYVPLFWNIQLGLLIPGGWNSLNDSHSTEDVFDDVSVKEITQINDSPMLYHWGTFTGSRGWCLIRAGSEPGGRLLLKEGCVYESASRTTRMAVIKIQTRQCAQWMSLSAGNRINDEEKYEDNIANRRPYLKIEWQNLNQAEGIWHMDEHIRSVLFGCATGRTHRHSSQIADKHFFNEWRELSVPHDWNLVRGQGVAEWASRRSQTLSAVHPGLCEEGVLPVFLYLGFDAYSATAFARSTSSITNFYIKCANKECASHRYWLYCSLPKSVPYHFVMQEIWKEMADWQVGIECVVCEECDADGTRFKKVRTLASMTGIVGDLENMEPMMQCVRSRRDSRTFGPFYRGSEDPLDPSPDFRTLDARFLKTRDWWRDLNRRTRESGLSRATIQQLRRMEGLSHHPSAHRWIPAPTIQFNELLQCLADPAHDFDRIFECLRSNILSSFGSEKENIIARAMQFLQKCESTNTDICLPSDPLGLKKVAKSDFRRNYRRTFWFYVSMIRVNPRSERLGVLRKALQCYTGVFQCRSGQQVFEMQCLVVDFLRDMERVFRNDSENVNIPKSRDLLRLVFVTLPLFRSIVSTQNLDMERTHRLWKRLLANHSNYKGDFINNARVRMREKMSAEYIWCGGRCGPNMDWSIDPSIRQRSHPSDPCRPLFEPPSVLGFGSMHYCSLRFDSITQQRVEVESSEESEVWWRELSAFCVRMGIVSDTAGLKSECVVFKVQSARIYDFENSDDFRVANKPRLFCGTYEEDSAEYTPFLMRVEEVIKVINLQRCNQRGTDLVDVESNYQNVLMAVKGKVCILALSHDWKERRRDCKGKRPMDYHYRVGRRRSRAERAVRQRFDDDQGGDELAECWIPGCCVISTAITLHMCNAVNEGGGCRVRRGSWSCDEINQPYLEVYHPKWLYCPFLFKSQSEQRVVKNFGRRFDLSGFL